MTRERKLLLNTVLGVVSQVVTIACGLILPVAILRVYGSSANGLINSIGQFLAFISLCELGVGAVVQSSLYKPLANNNTYEISCIIHSANKFFRIVGLILVIYVVGLCLIYPFFINEFSAKYVIAMILALSLDSFGQYFLGIKNNLLLRADQKAYVPLSVNTITIVLNTVLGLSLIYSGVSLIVLKLTTSIIYLTRPICLELYVRRHYHVDKNVVYSDEPIKQKWNGMAQHFASVIVDHTDTAVLTIFASLNSVSVYSVYYMVVSSIRQLVFSSLSGVEAAMGNMLSKDERQSLISLFGRVEWLVHTIVTYLFSVTGILIVPFIMIYTKGVYDTNYNLPLFAVLMVVANAGFSLQFVYKTIVKAAGHYKETQSAAIIEALINVLLSTLLVYKLGLTGVAVGTIVAIIYRLLYHVWYIKNRIIFRDYIHFIKHIGVDIFSSLIIYLSTIWINVSQSSYLYWLFSAIEVALISGFVVGFLNCLFYREYMVQSIERLFNRFKKVKS